MSRRNLLVYPNASKGGISSVIRGRAVESPEDQFDVVYLYDKGGRSSFDDLPNVSVVIVAAARASAYLNYLIKRTDYDHVSLMSCPDLVNEVDWRSVPQVDYEFHSSNLGIVSQEITKLDIERLDRVVVPSEWMRQQIRHLLPRLIRIPVEVVPNLIDHRVFNRDLASKSMTEPRRKYVLWIGRFDSGKGFRHFLRLLSRLEKSVSGIVLASFENTPERASQLLGEVYADRVDSRIELFLNLSQAQVADLYLMVKRSGGCVVSTSFGESFGYMVAEAMAVGVPIVAYDLPALREHSDPDGLLKLVDIGDMDALKAAVEATLQAASCRQRR